MKAGKYSGLLLFYTGVLHILTGLYLGKDIFAGMIGEGLIATVDGQYDREFAFWFLICGILLLLFGSTLHHYIKQTRKPAPAFLGWQLLVFSLAGCAVVPFSGFWLFIPQAVIILLADRRKAHSDQ